MRSIAVALFLCAAPALADAQEHVQAAKRAEQKREWSKALQEWKAAYSADPNAEYLIGIGDANVKLGNKEEAKKNYQAYLADPLALPDNLAKVKGKLNELNAALASSSLSLPDLELPRAAPPPKKVAAASALELPAAKKEVAVLDLPGAAPAKKEAAKETKPPAQIAMATPSKPPAQIAMATPSKPPERKIVPDAVIAEPPTPRPAGSSGTTRIVAYATAGVAVIALGGGALAMTKASQAHSDLVGKVHDGATAQQLLETEQRNKTVSFLSFAGGLVAAGIATALFAF